MDATMSGGRQPMLVWSRTIQRGLSAGIALALVIAPTVAAQEGGDPLAGREVFEANCAMCHGSDASGMMGGGMWMLAWMALFLVVLAAVVIGAVFITTRLWKRGDARPSSRRNAASEILEERFARGEIERDEYEERRKALQG